MSQPSGIGQLSARYSISRAYTGMPSKQRLSRLLSKWTEQSSHATKTIAMRLTVITAVKGLTVTPASFRDHHLAGNGSVMQWQDCMAL